MKAVARVVRKGAHGFYDGVDNELPIGYEWEIENVTKVFFFSVDTEGYSVARIEADNGVGYTFDVAFWDVSVVREEPKNV